MPRTRPRPLSRYRHRPQEVRCVPLIQEPDQARPLYESVLTWVSERLAHRGYPRPLCKRLALLVTGLVAGEDGTLSGVASTVHGLGVTPAKEESVARRVLRIIDDGRLDPETALPALLADLVPFLVRDAVRAHAANAGSGTRQHRRFVGVRVVVDETSKADRVHVLVAGLAYRGIVLPLAVRTWPESVAMPDGAYWGAVGGLLWTVHRLLPPELRDHVLLVADRAYGIARMVELALSLDWAWLLRVQWQTRVLRRDGRVCAIGDLVPRPGTIWLGHHDPPATRDAQVVADDRDGFAAEAHAAAPEVPGAGEPTAVFRVTGWRASQVVAVWPAGEAEPWLLVTNLPGTRARLREYAQRWAVERLFVCWKSHGWDLDAVGLSDPVRLGRLLTALAVATLWRLAAGLPAALHHLADLAGRAARRPHPAVPSPAVWQLLLPLWPAPSPEPPAPAGAARPWVAKFSLFTLGSRIVRHTPCRSATPALCWTFPDWDAPTWSEQAHQVYAGTTRQFSVSP
jgi:hypothetical protein